jgi:hypothetical protein
MRVYRLDVQNGWHLDERFVLKWESVYDFLYTQPESPRMEAGWSWLMEVFGEIGGKGISQRQKE